MVQSSYYPDPDPRELEVDRVFHLPSLPASAGSIWTKDESKEAENLRA